MLECRVVLGDPMCQVALGCAPAPSGAQGSSRPRYAQSFQVPRGALRVRSGSRLEAELRVAAVRGWRSCCWVVFCCGRQKTGDLWCRPGGGDPRALRGEACGEGEAGSTRVVLVGEREREKKSSDAGERRRLQRRLLWSPFGSSAPGSLRGESPGVDGLSRGTAEGESEGEGRPACRRKWGFADLWSFGREEGLRRRGGLPGPSLVFGRGEGK
uniref:Uncharacterized protein n=1 Tax=Populus alba TaxID=43335 RepID=A0A4V5ZZ42_POPAL|nr:hypothetical protein D5086_0000312720 [Populus alba]